MDPSRDEADSTDSETGEGEEVNHTACPHVGKAVQLSNIKKTLKIAWVRVGQCATCLKEKKTTTPVKRVKNEVLRRETGGKLSLQEIKKDQLERAKAEQRDAAEKLRKEREAKSEETNQKTDTPDVKVETNISAVEDEVKAIDGEVKAVDDELKAVDTKPVEAKDVEKSSVWLCMRCGSQGCGNNTKKHSYCHYKQPRSDLHCLVVNTDTWVIWCYECQTEIYVDSHKKLYEAVEFVKKVKGNPNKVVAQPRTNSIIPFGGVIKSLGKEAPLSTSIQSNTGSIANNSLPRVKGLNNLGNTCFFNSVLQCLSQTHILTQLIDLQASQGVNFLVPGSSANVVDESDSDSSSIKKSLDIFSDLSLKLAEGGPMLTSLAAFFKDMHSGGKSMVISPGHLFGQVVKQSPKFRGMQQQDSHELLRYLMDGLRNEESKRQKSAILKNFDLTEKTDPKNVPIYLRKKLQAYGRQGTHTLLDKIFSGQMVSTIVCEECHHSSQMYEQFLDLSLPVVEDKPSKPIKSPKRHSGIVLPDDEGQVSCCGAQEEKKSKGQIKKEKERRRKENRSNKKFARQTSKTESIEEGENKIREELQGTDKFEKVELKIQDSPKMTIGAKAERQDSVSWKDGNNDEEEGYEEGEEEGVEEEGDWEWDYGEPWEEKQQLIFKPKSKETTETNDDTTSDYLDVPEENPKQRLSVNNPMPEGGDEFEHEKSSDKTENNTEDETNETGASSNGDVEDNDCEEVKRKWVLSKNLLNNLQKLDNLMMNNDNLDPHMQELCKGISNLRTGDNSMILDEEKQQKQRVKAEWTARTLTSLAPRYQAASGECSIYSCLNHFTQSELLTGPNKWACDSCTENKKINSADNSDCSSSSKKSSTVYSSASKQLLLFSPPSILTLHLKRFQQTLSGCKKVNKHVSFPFELDLAAFCSSTSIAMPNVSLSQRKVLYSLYGVVEHSGRLQGGHYTAFVKVRAANSIVKDPTKFFSSSVSKASDVPNFLEEIENKFGLNERIYCGEEAIEDASNNNLTLTQPRRWYHVSDSSVSEVTEEKVLKAQAYLLFYERIL